MQFTFTVRMAVIVTLLFSLTAAAFAKKYTVIGVILSAVLAAVVIMLLILAKNSPAEAAALFR